MNTFKLTLGMIAFSAATLANAGTVAPTDLPLLEGGLLTAGVVGLLAGIRMIQRKK